MLRTTSSPARAAARILPAIALLAACAAPEEPVEPSTATAYEGARVLVGNGQTIESATIVVDEGRFVAVGPAGEVEVPDGAAVVDLSGRTVMPAIVDAHVHLSQTRDALVEDLEARARFGVGAALSLGTDGIDAPLDMRGQEPAGAARYKSAGRGITAPEEGRTEVPHWVTSEEEAREAVRAEAARNVDFIKIWVDTRGGQYEKLGPELYGAVIDEAHQHDLKVAAHIFELADAKGLLEAGVDAFAHGVRDQDVDDEFVEMVQSRSDVVLIPNMPGRGVVTDLSWLEGAIPADELARVQENNVERPEAQETFGIQARNLDRLDEAGMTIAMGTDGNTPWAPHVEMEDMVASGMAPGDVIVAATRNSAELAGFDQMGTVAAGKSADFVVLEANPLDDITNTRRIVDVYLRGEVVDRSR